MTRSYNHTYKQVVLRAIVELQEERGGSRRSRPFHINTLHRKIRDLAQAEETHLGIHRNQYIKKAVEDLIEENVLRHGKRRGYVALSSEGIKNFSVSRDRHGSFDKLSPLNKNQYLREITVPPKVTRSHTDVPRQRKRQFSSLRASLAIIQNKNESLALELEDMKKERDDLHLALLEMAETSRIPNIPPVIQHPAKPPFNRSSSQLTTPNISDNSTHVAQRPVGSFTHRSSGSFLNNISNQFTPSPSPGFVQPDFASMLADDAGPIRGDDNRDPSSDAYHFGEMEAVDLTDVNGDGTRLHPTSGEPSRRQAPDLGASEEPTESAIRNTMRTQNLEADRVFETGSASHDSLPQNVANVIEERDALRRANSELRVTLQDEAEKISRLEHALSEKSGAYENLRIQKELCEESRTEMETENARFLHELSDSIREVSGLTSYTAGLSVNLAQFSEYVMETQRQSASTSIQLEESKSELESTRGELLAAQAQLFGANNDLRSLWKNLQASKEQQDAVQSQLEVMRVQLDTMRPELDATKARLDATSVQFAVSVEQLHNSKVQLGAMNEELDNMRNDVQRSQGELQHAHELERKLRHDMEAATGRLSASQAEIEITKQEHLKRESRLASQYEDAQERISVLDGELQDLKVLWRRKMEVRRADAELDEQIQRSFLREHSNKRDHSIRDSGVSITV